MKLAIALFTLFLNPFAQAEEAEFGCYATHYSRPATRYIYKIPTAWGAPQKVKVEWIKVKASSAFGAKLKARVLAEKGAGYVSLKCEKVSDERNRANGARMITEQRAFSELSREEQCESAGYYLDQKLLEPRSCQGILPSEDQNPEPSDQNNDEENLDHEERTPEYQLPQGGGATDAR
jgi:hypothetical protein